MTEAPMPPGFGSGSGGQPPYKKPPQIQDHWWEIMAALPSQVAIPLRDATLPELTRSHRRCRRNHARIRLVQYRRDMREWMESVDAMLVRRGERDVDKTDYQQADAFMQKLGDSERRALQKCQRVRAALAYAQMSLDWLDWELSRGR